MKFAKREFGNDDRVYVNSINNFTVILIADGAGGTSGGSIAADIFILKCIEYISNKNNIISAHSLRDLLFQIDLYISNDHIAGETTGLIIVITKDEIFGASIGDCEAWSFDDGEINILTNNQFRKPLLGTKLAIPMMIEITKLGSALIVGTDGLFNYIDKNILNLVDSMKDPEIISNYFIDDLRLLSGEFNDDFGFVICQFH